MEIYQINTEQVLGPLDIRQKPREELPSKGQCQVDLPCVEYVGRRDGIDIYRLIASSR